MQMSFLLKLICLEYICLLYLEHFLFQNYEIPSETVFKIILHGNRVLQPIRMGLIKKSDFYTVANGNENCQKSADAFSAGSLLILIGPLRLSVSIGLLQNTRFSMFYLAWPHFCSGSL